MKRTSALLDESEIAIDELVALGGGEARSAQEYTGTKALMLAVLEDGINSYLHGKGRIRAEAEHWVTTVRRHSPFSFAVVCETLGLEPQAVRAALRRMRDTHSIPAQSNRRARPHVRRQRLTW